MQAIQVNEKWAGDPGRLLNLTHYASTAAIISSSARRVEVEVWAKLQPDGAVALLAINTAGSGDAALSVDLSQVWPTTDRPPAGWCTSKPCAIRDIWCVLALASSLHPFPSSLIRSTMYTARIYLYLPTHLLLYHVNYSHLIRTNLVQLGRLRHLDWLACLLRLVTRGQRDAGTTNDGQWKISGVGPHDSVFVLVSPSP